MSEPIQEPEDLIANALYLLQLCQQDINIGRRGTVYARAKRAKHLCEHLELLFSPWETIKLEPDLTRQVQSDSREVQTDNQKAKHATT